MDSITIYEFLKEKSTIPTGPGSYSNSKEMSNSLKAFKKNNNSKAKKKKDVNFYDYDGTLVDSYSTEEFLQLSTMPANPSHDGLTAQGWNYTFSDAKEYISEYGKLNIGQMYITNDGKTRLHIKLEDGRLKPCLGLGINGSAIVDWGDNSQTDTMTGSSLLTAEYQEHEYSAPGEYTISIAVTGKIKFLGDSSSKSQLLIKADGDANTNDVYRNSIKSIEIGSNILSIDTSAFQGCSSLTNITIHNNVTIIGNGAFQDCYSLTNITIPNNVIRIGISAFQNCYSLTNITIPNDITIIGNSAFSGCYSLINITIPNNVINIGDYVFQGCCSLTNITIPNNITSIGNSAFQTCYSLTNITIPNNVTSIGDSAFQICYSLTNITIPNNVTNIGDYAFNYCYSLTNITIPNNVTSIGDYVFQGCSSLTNITIPNNVTSIGNSAFQGCSSLTNIIVPNNVTSIGNSAFQNCYSLTNITIPNNVTSIGDYAFNYCFGLGFIKFESSTPTETLGTDAWDSIPNDCIIYIPQGSLIAYTNNNHYPNSSTYTYTEY